MRLASLARKIKIKPSELRSFLEENDIPLPSDSNTKLGEDAVDLVYRNFAPQYIIEEEATSESNAQDQQEEVVDNAINEESGEESEGAESKSPKTKDWSDELEPITEMSENSDLDPNSEEPEEQVELIKAPKVTLPGLTIKGKIDLPEPKPKKEPEEEKNQDEQKSRQSRNSGRSSRKRKHQEKDFNPLAEERKRKAREEERRRKEQAQRRKEQRRKRYETHIRSKIEPPRTTQESQSDQSDVVQSVPGKKKSSASQSQKQNMMARFWKWLNS